MNTVSDFIRWSPHSDASSQEFMTISARDHEVRLYNVTEYGSNDLSHETIFKRGKIPYIKCFDWSPIQRDVVAVGKSGGDALIMRMAQTSNEQNDISVTVKQQRGCNSVAFSSTGYLAVGLDKVRNDFCLNIWDVNGQLSAMSASGSSQPQAFRQLAQSEMISALQFFKDQPHVLMAGVGQKYLRAFDLRQNTTNASINFPTRHVHGVTIDKNQNHISSCSEDGYMAIWDRRYAKSGIPDAALSFPRIQDRQAHLRQNQPLTIHSLRLAREKSGAFGVLSNYGQLKVYQLGTQVDVPLSTEGAGDVSVVARFKDPSTFTMAVNKESLFVTRVSTVPPQRPTKYPDSIASFDWISDGSTEAKLRVITLAQNGAMTISSIPNHTPSLTFGSRNNFAFSTEQLLTVLPAPSTKVAGIPEPNHVHTTKREVKKRKDENDSSEGEDEDVSPKLSLSREMIRKQSVTNPEDFMFDPRDVLRRDISVTMRKRAEEGYELDCAKNEVLVGDQEPELREMWYWIQGALESTAKGGMMDSRLDLSYLGVLGIWRPQFPTTRILPQYETSRWDAKTLAQTVKRINEHNKRKSRRFGDSKYPEQRTLGLAMCGWDFDGDQSLENELLKLEAKGDHARAAGWALFHDDVERCIEALSRGGRQMKLMSTAVAGYQTQRRKGGSDRESRGDDTWKELCQEMATQMDDPYSRAIFAFVANGNWQDVLENSVGLPIREKLGIALRFLNDDKLGTYIDAIASTVIKEGSPEGILVTGITESAIDLLQCYVDKTGDVQTAALVSTLVVPKYFTDVRVDTWVDSYRNLLDRWKFFRQRAFFDIARAHASRDRNDHMTIDTPQRQVYVRCNFCDRSIAHNSVIPGTRIKDGQQVTVPVSQASATGMSQKAMVCPNCRKPLPRCAVCLFHLGTPNYKANSKSSQLAMADGEGGVKRDEAYDRWFNFCLNCNHGTHAGHARAWFSKHTLCPVPDCNCMCKVGVFAQ